MKNFLGGSPLPFWLIGEKGTREKYFAFSLRAKLRAAFGVVPPSSRGGAFLLLGKRSRAGTLGRIRVK